MNTNKRDWPTKADEHEALDQIIDILVKLGEDSYVSAALRPGIVAARNNIDFDHLDSPWEEYDRQAKEMKETIKQLKTARDTQAAVEDAIRRRMSDLEETIKFKDRELERRKKTIVELKARLYDSMTEEDF